MKLIEVGSALICGDIMFMPVCSSCGCEDLYIQIPGKMFRRNKCPKCGHRINWSNKQ